MGGRVALGIFIMIMPALSHSFIQLRNLRDSMLNRQDDRLLFDTSVSLFEIEGPLLTPKLSGTVYTKGWHQDSLLPASPCPGSHKCWRQKG